MRDILVFTGTRADFGLLRGLIRALDARPDVSAQLLVSGSHLDPSHGDTVTEIEAEGFPIAARVPIWSGDDGAVAAAVDTGVAVGAYARALARLKPELVVVLGDRLEAFAMATAATMLSIAVTHIHGGEITVGAMDDALRHSITKLSYLHLTTTDEHRRRVIQLGEEPARVVNLGAPIVDALSELDLLDRAEVETRFGVRLPERTAIMTFHPAAYDSVDTAELTKRALAAVIATEGLHLIVTGTNTDIGGAAVRAAIQEAVLAHGDRVDFVESFGQLGYLSAVSHAALVLGNSSSTVLEAPVLGTPSVLIGDRQRGRPISASVLVPSVDEPSIRSAIAQALTPEFAAIADARLTVFGKPGFAARAAEFLATAPLARPPVKRFHDVRFEA